MENIRYILYTDSETNQRTWKKCDSPIETELEIQELIKNANRNQEILLLTDGAREMTRPAPGRYPSNIFIVCWELASNSHRNWMRVDGYDQAAETVRRVLQSGGFATMWNESWITKRA